MRDYEERRPKHENSLRVSMFLGNAALTITEMLYTSPLWINKAPYIRPSI